MSSEEFMIDYIKAEKNNDNDKMTDFKNKWMEHYAVGRDLPLKIEIVNPKVETQFKNYYDATIKREKERKKAERELILRNRIRNDETIIGRVKDIDKKNKEYTAYLGSVKWNEKQKNKTRRKSSLRNEIPIKDLKGGKKNKTRKKRKKRKKNKYKR